MKSAIKTIALCALLGAGSAHATIVLIPNGDFSVAAGDQWNFSPDPGAVVTFETADGAGGAADGFGKIDATAGAWGGVLVAEGGTGPAPATGDGILLTALNLLPNYEYTFHWKQKDLAGAGSGAGKNAGVKVESWMGSTKLGESPEVVFPTTPTWDSQSLSYLIHSDADRIKVVPLANLGDNIVGFDDIMVDDVGVEGPPPPAPSKDVPNSNFDLGGDSWTEINDGGQTTYAYPATGGNPGAYGQMINTASWGIWVANGNSPQTLGSLGISVGDTITVKVDMRIDVGSSIGGMKVDFEGGTPGSTGDMFPTLIGTGTTWETYTWDVVIPPGTTGIKLVPLWGASSTVGYDNIEITCPVEEAFAATIKKGTVVTWSPTSPTNSHQPQESPDNAVWSNLGPAIIGNTVSSVCDSSPSPFYRVQETTPGSELVLDPSFETGGSWLFIGSPTPVEVSNILDGDPTSANSGQWSIKVAVDNGAAGPTQTSTLQQVGVSGNASAGVTYDFSFWTRIESLNGAVMNYSLQWRKLSGDVISLENGDIHTLPVGSWVKVSALGLVAPPETDSALIQFNCIAGAVPDIEGAFLVDDVSLSDTATASVVTLAAASAPGVEICWPSESGKSYQVNSGSSPDSLSPLGSSIAGTGSTLSLCDSLNVSEFFNVVETP